METTVTQATSGNREKTIGVAIATIEKQFGKGAIMKLGADALIRDIATISTGSVAGSGGSMPSGVSSSHWLSTE